MQYLLFLDTSLPLTNAMKMDAHCDTAVEQRIRAIRQTKIECTAAAILDKACDQKEVVIIRGFQAADAWELACALDALPDLEGAVVVYSGGMPVASIGRGPLEKDDADTVDALLRTPLATSRAAFLANAPFHSKKLSALIVVPRDLDDILDAHFAMDKRIMKIRNENLVRAGRPVATTVILIDQELPKASSLEMTAMSLYESRLKKCNIPASYVSPSREWDAFFSRLTRIRDKYEAVLLQGFELPELWGMAEEMVRRYCVNLGGVVLFAESYSAAELGKPGGKGDSEKDASWRVTSPLVVSDVTFLGTALETHGHGLNNVIFVVHSPEEIECIHEVIEDAKKACPHIPVIFVIVVPSPDCGEAMCKSIEKEMRTSYGKDNFVSKKMSFNQLM